MDAIILVELYDKGLVLMSPADYPADVTITYQPDPLSEDVVRRTWKPKGPHGRYGTPDIVTASVALEDYRRYLREGWIAR